MLRLMQQRPLLISSLLDYGALSRRYRDRIRAPSRGRCTAATGARSPRVPTGSPRLASARRHSQPAERHTGMEPQPASRNHFGVTCSGAVLDTVNPRLFPQQVRFIIDDAEASYVFFDMTFAPLVEQLAPKLPNVRGYVALCTRDRRCHPSMCRTCCATRTCWQPRRTSMHGRSSTRIPHRRCATHREPPATPKACCEVTRSAVLHSFALMSADTMAISARESLLLCAPLFHVNCWGNPFAAAGTGRPSGTARHEARRRQPVRTDPR